MTTYSKGEQESFSTLLNRFKKKLRKSNIMQEYNESQCYKKPSEVRKERDKKKQNKIKYDNKQKVKVYHD